MRSEKILIKSEKSKLAKRVQKIKRKRKMAQAIE